MTDADTFQHSSTIMSDITSESSLFNEATPTKPTKKRGAPVSAKANEPEASPSKKGASKKAVKNDGASEAKAQRDNAGMTNPSTAANGVSISSMDTQFMAACFKFSTGAVKASHRDPPLIVCWLSPCGEPPLYRSACGIAAR